MNTIARRSNHWTDICAPTSHLASACTTANNSIARIIKPMPGGCWIDSAMKFREPETQQAGSLYPEVTEFELFPLGLG